MKPVKNIFLSLLCGILSLILAVSGSSVVAFATTDTGSGTQSSPAVTDSEVLSTDNGDLTTDTGTAPVRMQAGYTFDDAVSLAADVGGVYPLSTKEFGVSLFQAVNGYRNGGMRGYVHLERSFFDTVSQFTLGFWTKLSLAEAQSASTLFLVSGENDHSVALEFVTVDRALNLRLTVRDGSRSATCSYNVSDVLTDSSAWFHIAVSYKVSGNVSLSTLYVNGKSSGASVSTSYVDLSRMKCNTAAIHGITVDDLYFTNATLDPGAVASLMDRPVAEFYVEQQRQINEGGADTPEDPDVPVTPVEKHDYSWAAYLFDGTFAAGTDYHSGDIPAAVDSSCVLIDTSKLTEKYGYAVIRREASVPSAYLTLDPRLFCGHSSFTFACWVYRNGKTVTNNEILLELKGNGVIRFSPYAAEDEKNSVASLEYTDSRGNLQFQSLKVDDSADPRNKWVHYALTVSGNGDLTVYIDGVSVGTFSSGVNPVSLAFSQCRAVVGASAYDTTRTAIDEVYVTPKALSDAEIRKIHVYGLERYTSEVLPDPGQTGSGGDSSNPYAPDAVDLAEDAYTQTGAIANGFIGTTFDERGNVGLDWNNGANATVTGGRLTQGISSYGLSLDGSSFVRYPAGILDGAESLTISLSYSWEGAGVDTTRSQRLFDFSRKTASVTDPSAYLFLEMGNGISGLRFGISDGRVSTYLTCDYNAVNTWTRITVTVSDGKITLYLNDRVAATGDTEVDLASICPNYCYLGRSGVKGDPMFTGDIDEVYIASQPLSPEGVAAYMEGISAAVNGNRKEAIDVWGIVLICIIVAAVVLVLVVVTVIIVIITKREKKSPEDEAPLPVPITGTEGAEETFVGPRSARRSMAADPPDGGDATVKFRKVTVDLSGTDGDMTATFKKISDDSSESSKDR